LTRKLSVSCAFFVRRFSSFGMASWIDNVTTTLVAFFDEPASVLSRVCLFLCCTSETAVRLTLHLVARLRDLLAGPVMPPNQR
jgi:hypothetical protein